MNVDSGEEQEAMGEMTEYDPSDPPDLPPPDKKRQGVETIDRITRDADPGKVSDSKRARLLKEWERTGKVIEQARKMLKDAIVTHHDATVELVSQMGRGPFRYKEKLYSVSAKGETVFLRELVAKSKD